LIGTKRAYNICHVNQDKTNGSVVTKWLQNICAEQMIKEGSFTLFLQNAGSLFPETQNVNISYSTLCSLDLFEYTV